MLERKVIFSKDIALIREKAKQKYINLLKNGISPSKILFLSINAHKFQDELQKIILENTFDSFEEIYIDNFSSFAKKIIRKFYYLLDLPKDFEVISGFEQKLLLKKILKEIDFYNYDSFKNLDSENKKIFDKVKKTSIFINLLVDLLDAFKGNISIYKNENKDKIDDFYYKYLEKSNLNLNIFKKLNFYNFYDIYKVYQFYLKEYNFLDYKDLIVKLIELFSYNFEVIENFKNNFSNVILEEAEEITELESYFLEILLFKKDKNIFFTYSDKSIFNYKGTDINFAKTLIKKLDLNEETIETNLVLPELYLEHFEKEEDEIIYVAEKIIDLIVNRNYSLKDIIVIRKNLKDTSKLFREIFNKYNIPFLLDGMGGIFDDKIIIDMILYLKILYILNNSKENYFNFKNFDNFIENFIRILFLNHNDSDILELKIIILEHKALLQNNFSREKFYVFLENLKNLNKTLSIFIDNFLEVLSFYKKNENLYIKDILFFICNKYRIFNVNFKKIDIIISFFKSIDDFGKIFNKIYLDYKKSLNIEDFVDFLDEFLETYTFELGLENNKENLLLISTISNSKFYIKNKKIVFFLGLNDEILLSNDEKQNIFFQKDEITTIFKEIGLDINFSTYYKDFSNDNDQKLFDIGINLAKEKCFLTYFDFINFDNKKKLNKSIFLDKLQNFIKFVEKDLCKKYLIDSNIDETETKKTFSYTNIEQNFIQKIKSKKYFSYSNVKNYLECSRKFLIENLFFIKNNKLDKNIFVGNIAHKILKCLHHRFNQSSDFATIPCKKYLKDLINVNFNINNNSVMFFFDCTSEAIWHKQKLENILLDYLDDSVFYSERKIIFLEKELDINFKNFFIKGRIDRIDDLGNGIYEIIDYKTSKAKNLKIETMKSAIKNLEELQFLFYYLILNNKKDFINFKDLKLSYIWLSKEKPSRIKHDSYKKFGLDSIFYDEFSIAEESLLDIFKKIIYDNFANYNVNLCEKCEHKFICLN